MFFSESERVSRAEGSASGSECLLDSSRTPARRSPPRAEPWADAEVSGEDDEDETGALGTGREFQSVSGRLGGVGGSLSRSCSPGVHGRGRLWSRPSEVVGAA